MDKIMKYEGDNLDLSFEVSRVSLKLLKKKTRKREKKRSRATSGTNFERFSWIYCRAQGFPL